MKRAREVIEYDIEDDLGTAKKIQRVDESPAAMRTPTFLNTTAVVEEYDDMNDEYAAFPLDQAILMQNNDGFIQELALVSELLYSQD